MKSKYYDFEIEPQPPFVVDVTDHYSSHDEDGFWTLGTYATLEKAIHAARELTTKSCQKSTSWEHWDFFGQFGLVYDARGWLVLDTSEEVKNVEGKAVHVF